jgi:predicted transcriptional regulator
MEKAEMQSLIGELMVENIMKDRQIEYLEWDKDHYIDKIDTLEHLIKRMGQEEEEALETINKASLRTLPFAEAAVD